MEAERMALVLVSSIAPEIEGAMLAGRSIAEIRPEMLAKHLPAWRQQFGVTVTRRAEMLLDELGPAAYLTPYGSAKAGLMAMPPTRRNRR